MLHGSRLKRDKDRIQKCLDEGPLAVKRPCLEMLAGYVLSSLSLDEARFGSGCLLLTFKEFSDHLCIGIFDFTSTLGGTQDLMVPLVKEGHLRVKLLFDKPTTEPLVLITILEKQSSLSLDDKGKCIVSQI